MRRDDMAFSIMQRSPPQAVKQWPDRSAQFLHDQLNRLTLGWAERRITNFDYLLHLNMLSGRSYNDICQYPVFPWVLSDYTSEMVPDLNDPKNYRDLSKPMGALNEQRLSEFQERFESFVDPSIPPFMCAWYVFQGHGRNEFFARSHTPSTLLASFCGAPSSAAKWTF